MDPGTLRLALAVLLFAAGNVALARDGEPAGRSRRAAALVIVLLSAGYILLALAWPAR